MKLRHLPTPILISLALVVPVSPNYALRELDFGAGGGVGQSTNYNYEGIMGENGSPMNGTAYNGGLGFGFTQMSNVPNAPTLTNPSNYYNKLHLVIDPSDNPGDALFAIAISSDDFTTTQYVKSDQAIGSSLTFSDYLDYSGWGGGSGFNILGLSPSTTYKVKVKAMQGDFTESGWGPTSTAATVSAQLTFDIDVAATDTTTSPPYAISFGTILAGTVYTASDKIWASIDTNGDSGARVYITRSGTGFRSSSGSYTIASVTGDLSALSEGYGLQGSSATQSSGGPLTIASPYNTSSDSVGQMIPRLAKLFESAGPIESGRGSAVIKAKVSASAPAKSDYSEIFTVVAAGAF